MAELSREKHRNRVRESYLKDSFDSLPDHNVLELILFYAIPRKDVKQITYDLMNTFGSLENVINADISELMNIKGIGENSAILISLFKNVNVRIAENRNKDMKKLTHFEASKQYVSNMLSPLTTEKVVVITLNNGLEIISCHTVSNGTVSCANVEPRKIMECALADKAAMLILGHNHPNVSYLPSKEDIEFTKKINEVLKPFDIKLADHVIVGVNGTLSMKNDVRYIDCFK